MHTLYKDFYLMTSSLNTADTPRERVSLFIQPYSHKTTPSLTGNALSYEAGTVLYGHYTMEYLLPQGDRIRLIANHNKKNVQIMLFTHDPELLKHLPGNRSSSLVADVISKINRYLIRSERYSKPHTAMQKQKAAIAAQCIQELKPLLKAERRLQPEDFQKQEELRQAIIRSIDTARDENRLLANNPIISEGYLGNALYAALKLTEEHSFNRRFAVTRADQMDFTAAQRNHESAQNPCFIWDSELHIGHDDNLLNDTLSLLCHHYKLPQAAQLNHIPANRFARLEAFLQKLVQDFQDWMTYLAGDIKPDHHAEVEKRPDGLSVTRIVPYYTFKGLQQQGYSSITDLVYNLTQSAEEPIIAPNVADAVNALTDKANDCWALVESEQILLVRNNDKLQQIRYFMQQDRAYPCPTGQDLYTLSQISKRHLYFPERASLQFKAFLSKIPGFFSRFYNSIKTFIIHDLHEEFFNHIHAEHLVDQDEPTVIKPALTKSTLHAALEHNGVLANGQTLEAFISDHIKNNPYVIARAENPPSPHAYDNPFHRGLGIIRHVASFFIHTSEQNPIIGSLAMAAYFYGAGAVIAPEQLKSLLMKLHLNGLISGIEPIQQLGRWMSHGTRAEAISASITCWQGIVVGGNLDKFFVEAVRVLKEDPAELAIVTALALSLGYGLTKVIPSLQHEMGEFPLPNYAALGGKTGAAIFDTVSHPGDDWLLGTFKWLAKNAVSAGKLVVAPFVEWGFYGFKQGFISGWKKSGMLFIKLAKQSIAAIADLVLALVTIPLIELSAMLVHIPFRGLTNALSNLLGLFGNIRFIGIALTDFGNRPAENNFISDFKPSPLYGFTNPVSTYSSNPVINVLINSVRILFIPVLQLIKNSVLLPAVDFISLTARAMLMFLNPASRIVVYYTGRSIEIVGGLWDKSIGRLFAISANSLTEACNLVDNKAGELRQGAVSFIEVQRRTMYYWAFKDDDLHPTPFNAQEYYAGDPMRCEKTPHEDSYCLLQALLQQSQSEETAPKGIPCEPVTHHDTLFATVTPQENLEKLQIHQQCN